MLFIDIDETIPDKGKDILGIDSYGNEHYCFRCDCHNPNCMEWRCSITGMALIINIVKWRYLV